MPQIRPIRRPSSRRRRGALSMEYMLILALVVIPLALLSPMILHMVAVYTWRIGMIILLPFG
jgi:hypothetical protein